MFTRVMLSSLAALLLVGGRGMAQDKVQLTSFDATETAPASQIDGYVFRPTRAAPTPAVVFLHGCGGLISAISHKIMSREMDWAGRLNAAGYTVLMADSFTTRGSGEMCSRTGFKEWLYLRRPADAYGALAWLQAQPFIVRDRIAVMGWSNGGGAALFAVGQRHVGRTASFAGPDFRAAVAFYPGSCSEERQGSDWTPALPLMVLMGAKDVWTPAAPCRALLQQAAARGAPVEFHAYDGAYHDFDWPNLKRKELVQYTTRAGVVPISGEEPAAHADAIERTIGFFGRHLQQ